MKHIIIILIISSLLSCHEGQNQISNENVRLAEEYGVADMIQFAPDVESVDREEWIEFLETAVEMKKTEEFHKKEYEIQKTIAEAFESELENAKNDEQRQEVWNRYGAKYDWIVTAESATIEK